MCIEIDLSKPLSRGFWVGDDSQKVFVVVMYERLPIFCYNCGLIGHGTNSCNQTTRTGHGRDSSPLCDLQRQVVSPTCTLDIDGQVQGPVPFGPVSSSSEIPLTIIDSLSKNDFGPWMLVSLRHGRAWGRGASSRASHVTPDVAADTRDGSNGPFPINTRSMRGGSRGSSRRGSSRCLL